MKHLTSLAIALAGILLVSGCGEVGDKAIKAAAKAVLEEENKESASPAQAPATVQPIATEQSPTQPPTLHDVKATTEEPATPQVQTNPSKETEAEADAGTAQAPKAKAPSERIVRHRASVLTQYGGNVIVRQSPNKNSAKKGYLYDQEEIWVVGITDKCETINKLEGCWVKVIDSVGLTGYSFDAYLQY